MVIQICNNTPGMRILPKADSYEFQNECNILTGIDRCMFFSSFHVFISFVQECGQPAETDDNAAEIDSNTGENTGDKEAEMDLDTVRAKLVLSLECW